MPSHSGDADVGGDQQPVGSSPGAQEAQPAAVPMDDRASGQPTVPKGQFDRIYQKLERKEAELAELRSKQTQIPEQPDFDAQIAEWQQIANKTFDTDPQKYTQAINQISALNAQKIMTSQMQQFMSEQKQAQDQQVFAEQNARARDRALSEFPELKNPESEFYRTVSSLYDGDPYLQQDPQGVYKAAQLAWVQRSQGPRSQSQSLDGARHAPAPAAGQDERKEYNDAINGMRAGDRTSAERYVEKNFERLLYSPKDPNDG